MTTRRSGPARALVATAAVLVLSACGSSDELGDSDSDSSDSGSSEEASAERITGDGYSFEIPAGWEDVGDQQEAQGADTFVRAEDAVDEFRSNINTIVTEAPGVEDFQLDDPELEQLREQLATSTEGQTGVRPEPIDDLELDGTSAIGHHVDEFEAQGRTLTLTQYLVVRDEVSYTVTLTAASADAEAAEDAAESVVESWTWE
jgi:hypothetical protein